MATIRILLVVLCFAAAGRSGVFGSGDVGYGRDQGSRANGGWCGAGGGYAGRLGAGFVEDADTGAERVVRAAQKEVGVQESAANAGARVDQYNAYVGLKKVAWCASFVSWCHGQAGYTEPRTAWSPALFPAGRAGKTAVRGGVIGIFYPELGRIGHCGIVELVRDDLVFSIEGNTNVNGGREGIGVFRRIRHKRTIAKCAFWLK